MLVTFQRGEEFDGDVAGLVTINLDHVVRMTYIKPGGANPYHRAEIRLSTGVTSEFVYLAPADADWDEVAQRLSDLGSAINGNYDALSEPVWSAPRVS